MTNLFIVNSEKKTKMTWLRDRTPEFTHNGKPLNFLKTKACSSVYHHCATVWTETTDPSHKAWGSAKHLFRSKQTKQNSTKQNSTKQKNKDQIHAKQN